MADYEMLDGLQQAIIADEQKKQANKKKEYKFDKLKLLFMEDYEVKGVRISQPTINDILVIGEGMFYQALSPFLYNSTSIRVMLWDAKIDWCNVKDIEVFSILMNRQKENESLRENLNQVLKILFRDIDMTDFILFKKQDESFFLYSPKYDIELNEDDYMEIAEYIREMMNIHPKVEKAKGKTAKKWMIDEDRVNALQKKDEDTSTLLPLISACINHPGFKYKLQDLREVGIYQFMDSVRRLQIYESCRALLNGRYAGFGDFSKVPEEKFDFMQNI